MDGSFEVVRVDDRMIRPSRKSDPSIQGTDGPPWVLPMESDIEDYNKERLCGAMRNARPKGWDSSMVGCWAPLVSAEISRPYPVHQRENVNTVCCSHLPMSTEWLRRIINE